MTILDYISIFAGGPGSGRKPSSSHTWSDLSERKAHERARLNPKQLSIFGPAHAKEILSRPKEVKDALKRKYNELRARVA